MVVVARIARREVQNLTPWSGQVRAVSRARRLNRRRRASSRFEHAVDGFGQRVAGEAPGR
jgi:hypothetical protein